MDNVVGLYPESTVNSADFSFKNNVFVGNLSTLEKVKRFQTDAAGNPYFFIQSETTGETRCFKFLVSQRKTNNELECLLFRCTDAGFRHLEAKLIND